MDGSAAEVLASKIRRRPSPLNVFFLGRPRSILFARRRICSAPNSVISRCSVAHVWPWKRDFHWEFFPLPLLNGVPEELGVCTDI